MYKIRMTMLGSLLLLVIAVSACMSYMPVKEVSNDVSSAEPVMVPYLDKNITEITGGNECVSDNKTITEDESVSSVTDRFTGETIKVTGMYDDTTGESIREECRITGSNDRQYTDGTRSETDSSDVRDIDESNQETGTVLCSDESCDNSESYENTGAVESREDEDSDGRESDDNCGLDEQGHFESELIYLGNWTITFYCPCAQCCGSWATGCTANGNPAIEWYTVATDQFDFGTQLYIEGLGYFVVDDRGVSGEWIDVFVSDHQTALDLGVQHREVYLVN